MLDWIAASFLGLGLGMAFYGCVRLRMHFGPIIYKRYGKLARHAYWLLTIVVMVLLANLGLVILRDWIADASANGEDLLLEIWFALVALTVSLLLIFRQLKTDNCEPIIEEQSKS